MPEQAEYKTPAVFNELPFHPLCQLWQKNLEQNKIKVYMHFPPILIICAIDIHMLRVDCYFVVGDK